MSNIDKEIKPSTSQLKGEKNNFALSTHTPLEERVKAISPDDMQRKSQNASKRETLENSKSSAETSRQEVQTDHLAVSTDETSGGKSEEKLNNLNKLQDKMPQESDTYPDPKSGSTGDDSAAYLTGEEKSEEELDNLNNVQEEMLEETNTDPDPKSLSTRDDSVAYSTHEGKPKQLDNLNKLQAKMPQETDTYPDPKSGSTRDDSVACSTHKGKPKEELDNMNNMQEKMPEETDTCPDSKSGITRDDSAAYETSMTKIKEISSDGVSSNFQHSTAQNESDNSECLTETSHLEGEKNNFAPSTDKSLKENAKDLSLYGVLKKSQNTSPPKTLELSKSSVQTFHQEVGLEQSSHTDETSGKKSEESDNLNKLKNEIPEETYNDAYSNSKHPSFNVKDSIVTHDDNIVDHDKFKPTGSTDNTSIENHTQKTVHTTQKALFYVFLILSTMLYVFHLIYPLFAIPYFL